MAQYIKHLANLNLPNPLPKLVTYGIKQFCVLIDNLNHTVHVAVELAHVDIAGYKLLRSGGELKLLGDCNTSPLMLLRRPCVLKLRFLESNRRSLLSREVGFRL